MSLNGFSGFPRRLPGGQSGVKGFTQQQNSTTWTSYGGTVITTQMFEEAMKMASKHNPETCGVCLSLKNAVKNGYDTYMAVGVKESEADVNARLNMEKEQVQKQRNKQREALGRVFGTVERAIAELPDNSNGAAGYLQAQGYRGELTPSNNAIVKYLRFQVSLANAEPELLALMSSIQINVHEDEINLALPNFQLSITPPAFITRLVQQMKKGSHPRLLN